MRLYLVVGENHMPLGERDGWGICGLYKNYEKAWSCATPGFDFRRVIEIETDLWMLSQEEMPIAIDDYETQLKKPYSRMIRLED